MESLGVPGKIQVSEATSNILIEAGKGDWVTEREGGVEAKGKGFLRTFFITPKSLDRSSTMGSSHLSSSGCDTASDTADSTEDVDAQNKVTNAQRKDEWEYIEV